MEVILKEDVLKLGHRGDVVKVADGYGRNYLLPEKLAIEATAANKAPLLSTPVLNRPGMDAPCRGRTIRKPSTTAQEGSLEDFIVLSG